MYMSSWAASFGAGLREGARLNLMAGCLAEEPVPEEGAALRFGSIVVRLSKSWLGQSREEEVVVDMIVSSEEEDEEDPEW